MGVSEVNSSITADIVKFCEDHGIDPAIYTSALNDGKVYDDALLKDPFFEAYWELTYIKLMELINPPLVQSMYAQVGGDADSVSAMFDQLYAQADPELNKSIESMVLDNPELAEMFSKYSESEDGTYDAAAVFLWLSGQAPESYLVEDSLFGTLENNTANQQTTNLSNAEENGESSEGSSDPYVFVDEQARRLQDDLGLHGTVFDTILGQEESIESLKGNLMKEMGKLDAFLADLDEALNTGKMSKEQFQTQFEQFSLKKQLLLGLYQQAEHTFNNMLQMFSQLIKSRDEQHQMIIRNQGAL